jgi:hypothetical protein
MLVLKGFAGVTHHQVRRTKGTRYRNGGEGGTRTPKSLRTPDFESGTLPIRIPLRSRSVMINANSCVFNLEKQIRQNKKPRCFRHLGFFEFLTQNHLTLFLSCLFLCGFFLSGLLLCGFFLCCHLSVLL